ncbi:MAG: hypothetical protein ABI592_08520 [Acidobacteriota bacterium]
MKRFLVSSVLLSAAALLPAQTNTSAANAADYGWGHKATTVVSGATSSQYWFVLRAIPGRCYCVETANFEGSYGDKNVDTIIDVYRQDQTTLITENDDTLEEPPSFFFSRACWIHNFPIENIYVRVSPNAPTVPTSAIQVRFVETTLFCPWFFIAGDYNAFSLIRNTSITDLPGVVVTWRGLNGAVAGSTTVTVPANGTVVLNARTFVNPALFSNGSVEIAHAGSPEQLQGSTTTLSGTTGLGFDAQFTQRKAW